VTNRIGMKPLIERTRFGSRASRSALVEDQRDLGQLRRLNLEGAAADPAGRPVDTLPGTDMISAVIGEELGLVGILGVVGLFGMFGFAGLRIAQKAKDNYGKILVAGLTSMILVTAMINLFAGDGPGAADRCAAALHLLRELSVAQLPVRGRADPQRRPRRDRERGEGPGDQVGQTARSRWRALARA